MTKRTFSLAVLLTAQVGAGCFSERSTGPDDTTTCTSRATTDCVVAMNDNSFSPATIRVSAGSTVTWENRGDSPHTSTGDGWDSGTVVPDDTFERQFDATGSFDYECVFHSGMTGTVVVE